MQVLVKWQPDLPDPICEHRGEPFPEEDITLDNISVSDSEEDDGFNHWSSNESRYVCIIRIFHLAIMYVRNAV